MTKNTLDFDVSLANGDLEDLLGEIEFENAERPAPQEKPKPTAPADDAPDLDEALDRATSAFEDLAEVVEAIRRAMSKHSSAGPVLTNHMDTLEAITGELIHHIHALVAIHERQDS